MAIEQLDNTPRCQHVRLSGRRCKAPARRGRNYCLFHEAEHAHDVNLTFPPVEDAATVAVATDQVLQALRDDTIDFRRASLLFSGLRIARANLKQLGMELGEELQPTLPKPVRVGHPEELPGPSLAEILLERLDLLESEDAREQGRAAPEPVNIEEAKASGKDLGEMLLERLQKLEDEECGVAPELAPPQHEEAAPDCASQ